MFVVVVLTTVLGAGLGAPTATAQAVSLAPTLAEGWTALAAGDLPRATSSADRALTDAPRSANALALRIEIDLTRNGAAAALDSYERWLGSRKVEAPYILRQVARGHLRAVATARKPPASVDALAALAADGDQDALTDLGRAAEAPGSQEAKLLAAMGDPRAVQALIGQLRQPVANKLGIISALGDSGSPAAIQPLVELLTDPHEELRAGAAEALGRLGASDSIPKLKGLLQDPVPPVRLAAAAALYRLQDYSGAGLLQPLMASDIASVRLSAAQAMAVTPTPEWQATVRALLADPNELVQLGAARLMAPHDPQASAEAFERLGRSDNMAIREQAARSSIRTLTSDFTALRRYLRNADPSTSVQAANRILELTR
ncbi:MAG TPA: HEAT repeat domain-containing protein [Vicinamibacterales bacterium]|jgi:HEAT repeat protein